MIKVPLQFCKAKYLFSVLCFNYLYYLSEYSSRDKTDLDVIKEEHRCVDFQLIAIPYWVNNLIRTNYSWVTSKLVLSVLVLFSQPITSSFLQDYTIFYEE